MSATFKPTPAIVPQDAVRRLPRAALWLLCMAYVLPGFLIRQPWKSADVSAFGVMRDLAGGSLPWLAPGGFAWEASAEGLLAYWLGAASIIAFPMLDAALASRLPFIALLALTLGCTWYSVYYLARQDQAQPVAFAFGGEASPTDYARAMADGALLALLACLGLAQMGHETTQTLVQLAFGSLLLFSLCALPWARRAAIAAFAVSQVALALSGYALMSLLLGLAGTWLASRDGYVSGDERSRTLGWMALACVISAGLALGLNQWGLGVFTQGAAWHDPAGLARLLLWFTWPAWPLALWALWRWRRQWSSPHLAIPLAFGVIVLATTCLSVTPDRSLLPGLPAFAALAAFALPTMHRSVSALIDWFTLLFFSGCAFVIWVIWISLHTGVPAKPAANVARLAPGFEPNFSAVALLLALIASAAWVWLVRWRAGRHRAAIWKSLALPAGGAVLCWVLLVTLWLPMLDYARSYAPLTRKLVALMGHPACVHTLGLTRAQSAGIGYHGQLVLTPMEGAPSCPWLLMDSRAVDDGMLRADPRLMAWQLTSTIRRPADKNEDLHLFRLKDPGAR